MNDTHAIATIPRGVVHRPRLNGPGTNVLRPEVMRRKMGVMYERYSPITAIL